jgi:hypothetical protein
MGLSFRLMYTPYLEILRVQLTEDLESTEYVTKRPMY